MNDSVITPAAEHAISVLIDLGYAVATKSSEAPRAGLLKSGGWKNAKWNDEAISSLTLLAPQVFRLELCNMAIDNRLNWLECARELRHLNMTGSAIVDESLKHLPRVRTIEALALARNSITDAGLSCISEVRIGGLVLNETSISANGLRQLHQTESLQFLDVENTTIDDTVWEVVAKCCRSRPVEWLNLGFNRIRGLGIEAIKDVKVDSISLRNTRTGNEACESIAALSCLRRLGLENTLIDDDALSALSRLKSLTMLRLRGTRVTDAGIMKLVGLRELQTLDLTETQVTPEGVIRFRRNWSGSTRARSASVARRLLEPHDGKLEIVLGDHKL